MYKTIATTLVAGQLATPFVSVPGRLIGVAVNLDTVTRLRLAIRLDNGLFANTRIQGAVFDIDAQFTAPQFVPYNTVLPFGTLDYSLVLTAVQIAAQPVIFVFDPQR